MHRMMRRKTHFNVIAIDCLRAHVHCWLLALQAKERERAVEQERKALEQRVERLQKVVK